MAMVTRSGHDLEYLIQKDRIHGSVYSDPDIFELEMEKIFTEGWVFVGHASEIPEPGDYRLGMIGRQSVIMVRDQSHEVQVLMNRCRHRANAVCQAERGNTNFFRCAYHGWTYKCNGDLLGVTYAAGFADDLDKSEMGLTKAPRKGEYRGFIFCSMSPTGISLEEHLGKATKYIDRYADLSPVGEVEARVGISKYMFKANWKFQAENTMDQYHANFTHQAGLGRGRARTASMETVPWAGPTQINRDLEGGHSVKDYIFSEPPTRPEWGFYKTPEGQQYVDDMEKSYGKERAWEILAHGGPHMTVFPNLEFVPDHIRIVVPVEPGVTIRYDFPSLLKGVPVELNQARIRSHNMRMSAAAGTAPDDIEMFARNQLGLSATVNPWLTLKRGLRTEYVDTDGSLVGETRGETPQRAFWQHWKKVLAE